MLSGIRQEFSLRTRSFWEKTLFWKAKQGPGCSFRPIKTTSCEHVTKREGSQLWCHKTPERWLLWKLTVPPSLEWLMSPHEFENKVVSFRQHLPNWWFPPRGLAAEGWWQNWLTPVLTMATRIIIKFTGQLCFIYMKERVYPENTKVKSH